VRQSTRSEEEDIAMPRTDETDTRRAHDQEADRNRLAEEKSANDKSAVKEPEGSAVEHQASKIIGNG